MTPSQLTAVSAQTYDEALDWLHEHRWSDGLPVVPATAPRVAAMLAPYGGDPDEPLGPIPPLLSMATPEKLAVVAVMAGCAPRAFPVVVAAVRALLDAPFRVASVQSSTSPAAPLVVVSGAARGSAGVASGTGCFGPATGTNVAIGRAVRFALQLIGGGHPGDADPATIGSPAKIAMCFGENEEASPWPSLAARRGVDPRGGAVSVFAVTGLWQISEPSASPPDVAHQVLHGMINTGHCAQPKLPEPGDQLLVVSPPVARLLAVQFPTIAELQAALFETVRVPLSWLPEYKRAATAEHVRALGHDLDEGAIPLAEGAKCFQVVVAGGEAGVQSIGMSTSPLSRGVTRPIV